MIPNRINDIMSRQKQLMNELEHESNALLNADFLKENEQLKEELHQLQQAFDEKSQKLLAVSAQNIEFKNALYQQIFNEKLTIVEKARRRNVVYFKSDADGHVNRLITLQLNLQHRANQLSARLKECNNEAAETLIDKFNKLMVEAETVIAVAQEEIAREYAEHAAYSYQQFDSLKNEQITDEVVAAIGKKNNLEAFVGGNLINKAGIIFIILGIITISQIAFFQMPDTFRAIVMFAISGLFLFGGELLNRRKASVFSLSLTSSGVAGLYSSLAVSYFMFEIIGLFPSLLVCVLITVIAFMLSVRYSSQTVATFSLVGGYIPMVSITAFVLLDGYFPMAIIRGNMALIYSALGYFAILNSFALVLSFFKKWKICMFVGFGLNLLATLYIVFGMREFLSPIIVLSYALFTFAIYTVIPIVSCYRTRRPFSQTDFVLLAINTVVSSIIMYMSLLMFDLQDFTGLMAVVFAAIYIVLSKIMQRAFPNEKHSAALFFITGMTFVVLVVPMQFGVVWLSLGWSVQAVFMACYGILKDSRRIKLVGYIVDGLCLAAFILHDLPNYDQFFRYRYMAVTVGGILILAALAYKKSLLHSGEKLYKYVVLVNVWIYTVYFANGYYDAISRQMQGSLLSSWFVMLAVFIAITFLFAFILPHIPGIKSRGTKIMSISFAMLGMIMLIFQLADSAIVPRIYPPLNIWIVLTFIIALTAIMGLFAMHSVLMFFVVQKKLSVEWLPFGISAYFLLLLTISLVAQYNIDFTSIVISIIYVVAALAWIIYGFVKRFAFMRRFGLALSILAVAKLFLIDLPGLDGGYRIISYFAFGATLLGISYVYQHFSKRFAQHLNQSEDEKHVD